MPLLLRVFRPQTLKQGAEPYVSHDITQMEKKNLDLDYKLKVTACRVTKATKSQELCVRGHSILGMINESNQMISLGTHKCQVNKEKESKKSPGHLVFSSCVVSVENELLMETLSSLIQKVNPDAHSRTNKTTHWEKVLTTKSEDLSSIPVERRRRSTPAWCPSRLYMPCSPTRTISNPPTPTSREKQVQDN